MLAPRLFCDALQVKLIEQYLLEYPQTDYVNCCAGQALLNGVAMQQLRQQEQQQHVESRQERDGVGMAGPPVWQHGEQQL